MNTGAETERRKLNVMDAMLIATLLGLGALIFDMRDAVVGLEAAQASMVKELVVLQTQFSDIPRRVTVLETRQAINIEAVRDLQAAGRRK